MNHQGKKNPLSGFQDFTARLEPGMSVFIPGSSGEPTAALEALALAPECCAEVNFITSFLPGVNRFDLSRLGSKARFTVFFAHPSLKQADLEGRVDTLALSYSQIADWLQDNPVDLAVAQVSSECRHQTVSLGPAVEFTPIVLRQARSRLAVRNRQTPWLDGSPAFSLNDFDDLIEADTLLPSYRDPEPGDVYTRIGLEVALLIPDGATLQTGLGLAPAAVLDALSGHRGLKLHSGACSHSTLRLIECGAMPASSGPLTGVALGDEAFYRQLSGVRQLRYASVLETHSTVALAAIDPFFTINSAIEVDLGGNLNVEFVQGRRVSGRGGLPDFAAAGHASPAGASIIVLPSSDNSGKHSRIVDSLEYETSVPGKYVDYVITEYGCAELKGKSASGRARAIRSVAAPHFRQLLN